MRQFRPATWRALAIASTVLVGAASLLLEALQHPLLAQSAPGPDATDEEDDGPPPANVPRAPPKGSEERPLPPKDFGSSRRPDPFEANDVAEDAGRGRVQASHDDDPPHPAAARHPDHDVVVCIAGCDNPQGTIVYKKKR